MVGSRGSVKEGMMSTISVASAAIMMPRDEKCGGRTPSSPGAGSLHSLASIATVTSIEHGASAQERWWSTMLQVAVPFFLAGAGTIGAGLTLGYVQASTGPETHGRNLTIWTAYRREGVWAACVDRGIGIWHLN
jgi:hypothetical protein